MRVAPMPAVQAVPNVTPMIDVMLVLLVIFMVIAPTLLDGMRAVPPQTEHAVSHPAEEADEVLGIDAAGVFYLNKQPIARDQLAGAMRSIYTGRIKDRVLYVRADRSTSYALVLEALDVAAKNGVVVVGMISEQRAQSVDAPSRP